METQRLRVALPDAKYALIFKITKLNYGKEISEVFAHMEMHYLMIFSVIVLQ